MNARNGSDLCLQCGACCDGTLFDRARLGDDQFDLAASLGMETARDPEGSGGFVQPCPRFRGGCCSIYDQPKPRICGDYQCGLLRAYLAGDENLDRCLASINLVRSLAHELEVAMGIAAGTFTMGALTEHLAAVCPWNAPEEHERLLMATLRFDARRHEVLRLQAPVRGRRGCRRRGDDPGRSGHRPRPSAPRPLTDPPRSIDGVFVAAHAPGTIAVPVADETVVIAPADGVRVPLNPAASLRVGLPGRGVHRGRDPAADVAEGFAIPFETALADVLRTVHDFLHRGLVFDASGPAPTPPAPATVAASAVTASTPRVALVSTPDRGPDPRDALRPR